MHEAAFMETVSEICRKDPRYRPDAYIFIREALDFTTKALKKMNRGPSKHVSGQELMEGVRRYALQEYGPMALTVLQTWGITRTDDFGEIVFNLVESGKLGKTDEDTREDFANGYDFRMAFENPFLPKSARRPMKRPSNLDLKGDNDA